jgi:F-type H+-transporting ATPase subunit alpha
MTKGIDSNEVMRVLREQLAQIGTTVDQNEASIVTSVGDGIARIAGLKTAMAGELLEFSSSRSAQSVFGLAQNLDKDSVGAVLFGDVDAIKEGDECHTTGRVMDIPVGRAMLGRVVNPL